MTKSNVLRSIEADAERYGFFKRRLGIGGNQSTAWVINCSKCPKEFRAYWPPNTSPALMVKNMRKRHWDVGLGERPLCSGCAHKKDRAPEKKPATSFEVHVPELPRTVIAHRLVDAGVKLGSALPPPMPTEVAISQFSKVVRWSDNIAKNEVSVPPSVQIMHNAEVGAHEHRREELRNELTGIRAKIADNDAAVAALALKERQDRMEAARKARLEKDARRDAEIKRQAEIVAQKKYLEPTPAPKLSIPTVEIKMTDNKLPTPSPKITHVVFQQLDAVFNTDKRLYNHGWTDQRVAQECGTSEEVVAYLRRETFGELSEDPRVTSLREDIRLMEMEFEDITKKFNAQLAELRSRVDQMAAHFKGR